MERDQVLIDNDTTLQLQQMLETPIEDQAGTLELALLGNLLQNGMKSLMEADNGEEAGEILRQVIKSAFVIGRRHYDHLA